MAEVIAVRKRRGWPKILLGIFLFLVLALVVAYFVVTSSAFFKGVILPQVSKSLNAQVTVADASIHPFSGVELHQVNVQTTGTEPLLKAENVRVRYHLFDILKGNYRVDEITVSSPTVVIITNPDGSSNLDPLIKKPAQPSQPAPSSTPSKPSAPPQVDLTQLLLTNATVRVVDNLPGGGRTSTEVSGINVLLSNLRNGQTAKLTLGANITMNDPSSAPGTNTSLQAAFAGSFNIALLPDLKPGTINGNAHLDIQKAGGAMSDYAGFSANLDCDVSPTEIKQVVLRFQKSGESLGELRASGPLDMAKSEGRIQLNLSSIDRRVLNLVGAKNRLDFGATTISSTNQIDLMKGGASATIAGQFDVAKLSVARSQQTTPTLDFHADYQVVVNNTGQSTLVRKLDLNGTQNQKPLLRVELTSPMTVAWGAASNTVGDSAMKLAVTNLNLADWKPFLGDDAPAGVVNVTMNLLSQEAGKHLTIDLDSQIDNLTAKAGSNQIRQAGVSLQARAEVRDMDQVNLSNYRLQLMQQGQSMVTIAGSGQCAIKTGDADIQLTMDAALPKLFQAMAQPDMTASAGTVSLKGHVVSKQQNRTVTGTLTVADLTGQYGKTPFDHFGATLNLNAALNEGHVQITKAAGSLQQAGNSGGTFDLSGDYDETRQSGQLTIKLTDLNQYGLRPFLMPALGGKNLVSVSLNGSSTAEYAAGGDSSVKADFQLSKLVVTDPQSQIPATPLEAGFKVDASLHNQIANIRQFLIKLTPTDRATNELTLSGQIDMTQSNAIQGSLKLASQSLDFTRYYDLFTGGPPTSDPAAKKAAAASSSSPPPAASGLANAEPAAINLPFHNFSFDANIARCYMHEIDISNFQTTAKIEGNRVTINPFQLGLNGAPVKGTVDLNLGVAGWQYDVAFSASKIPVAPIANSFSTKYNGRAKGELSANAQIKGAGITGTSLQKNLAGTVSLSLTNADVDLNSTKVTRIVVTTISIALGLPELTQSPIQWMTADAKLGGGSVNLDKFEVASSVFTATTEGTVTIANVLSNSVINNLPVNFSIPIALAQKAHIASANQPTNTQYESLGKIATVEGTIGDVKTRINYAGIGLEGVSKAVTRLPGAVGGGAGSVLKGVENLGGILTGKGPTNNNSATNQSSTNKPSGFNPFDLLKKQPPK